MYIMHRRTHTEGKREEGRGKREEGKRGSGKIE